MKNLEKRRNGVFTCLDCSKSKTSECGSCVSRNWEFFDLDKEIVNLSYSEKNKRYEEKHYLELFEIEEVLEKA